jgi:hypothetical protein
MRELRGLSKLPSEQAYWDQLEARISAELEPGAPSLPVTRSGWWAPVATRAMALSGLAAAAGLAALLLVPPRTRNEAGNPAGLLRLPDDPAMIAFLSAPEPPSLGALMASLPRSTP